MWLPQELYDSAKRSSKITFYCAYGHPQIFSEGESDLDIVRRERDQLKQQLAQRDDEISVQARLITNLKTQRKVVARRIGNGVCPCCNRTFAQLARHMAHKHPDFRTTA